MVYYWNILAKIRSEQFNWLNFYNIDICSKQKTNISNYWISVSWKLHERHTAEMKTREHATWTRLVQFETTTACLETTNLRLVLSSEMEKNGTSINAIAAELISALQRNPIKHLCRAQKPFVAMMFGRCFIRHWIKIAFGQDTNMMSFCRRRVWVFLSLNK